MYTNFTLNLQYHPPFEAASLLAFLQRRAIPGVEEVINTSYRRTVLLPRSKGLIELEPMEQTNSVQLRLQLNDVSDLSILEQRCRHLFDLDAVPETIAGVLAADPSSIEKRAETWRPWRAYGAHHLWANPATPLSIDNLSLFLVP